MGHLFPSAYPKSAHRYRRALLAAATTLGTPEALPRALRKLLRARSSLLPIPEPSRLGAPRDGASQASSLSRARR